MFIQNLVKARSHIIFLLAVISAFALVSSLDNISSANVHESPDNLQSTFDYSASSGLPLAKHRPLTNREMQWAETAWRYFENNTVPHTGLVNSVDRYQATTMWDTASYLMALIAAERLSIIDPQQFELKSRQLLQTLATLPLYNDQLPNKSYNTESAAMVDYNNQSTAAGIGWSAIDISRLIVPLQSLLWNHPHLAPQVTDVTTNWDLSALVNNGELIGALNDPNSDNRVTLVQEGRLGYEEYAARALQLRGLNAEIALDYFNTTGYLNIYGNAIPFDTRSPEVLDAHNFVTSEPFILAALETGWDRTTREFGTRLYRAQMQRYQSTGLLTAVSEDHLDREPWFVYNSVIADGQKWTALTEQGQQDNKLKTLSTKAAFSWHAIFDTDYTAELIDAVENNFDAARGWYAGIYEDDATSNTAITANTNAVVLMSLAYVKNGTLLRPL